MKCLYCGFEATQGYPTLVGLTFSLHGGVTECCAFCQHWLDEHPFEEMPREVRSTHWNLNALYTLLAPKEEPQ